jgi:hypothetical protein
VSNLICIIESTVHQQQQQQQKKKKKKKKKPGIWQQPAAKLAAELMQLLQQHLRVVLLPLLLSATTDVAAVMQCGHILTVLCRALSRLLSCVVVVAADTPQGTPSKYDIVSAVVDALLRGAPEGSGEDSATQQQQQLFGLLLLLSKAVMHMSQLPGAVIVSAAGALCSALTKASLVANQAIERMKEQQQQQQQVGHPLISYQQQHDTLAAAASAHTVFWQCTADSMCCCMAGMAGGELGTNLNIIVLMHNCLEALKFGCQPRRSSCICRPSRFQGCGRLA